MKIALLADIHGNHMALSACLDDIDRSAVSGIAFLGDYVTDGPYPQKTMDLLRNRTEPYRVWFVRGNREEYMLRHQHHPDDGWRNSTQTGALLYTYENLTVDDLAFFEQMPVSQTVDLPDSPSFTICHGSPDSTTEWLLPDSDAADRHLEKLKTDTLFCGHTHVPFTYKAFGKTLINCASAGSPTNGQCDAQFVMLEQKDDRWVDTLISVPYDIDGYIAEFETSGLADQSFMWAKAVIRQLQTGQNYPLRCIRLAQKIGQERFGTIPYSEIPESVCREAALKLGII